MITPRRKPTVGLPRHRAGWICVAWFLLGVGAILAALPPLLRDLRRQAELEMLSWLQAEGDTLRPLVEPLGPHDLGAALPWPVRREASPGPATRPRYANQAQLWLVSATEGEPGLIIPVSADFVAPESLRDFSLLQAGIVAARSSATRPLAWVDGPGGRQVVAYLRLVGSRYGVSTSMPAGLLYRRVTPRLVAVAAVAATLLACACAGLFRLIVAPAAPAAATPVVPAAVGVSRPVPAPALPEATLLRVEASLQRILYHADTLAHEEAADPLMQEHCAEIRETARQGLADLQAKGG